MIIKNYLPFRYVREGCIPDRLVLRPCKEDAEACFERLQGQKKTAHFHLGRDGNITALTPLSCAANLLGPTGTDPAPSGQDLPLARRGILILTEGDTIGEEQRDPLLRLVKRIQKEHLRIFGEAFPFCRKNLLCDPEIYSPDLLLELGACKEEGPLRFRVQTGCYRSRKDAEERVSLLTNAGIAAYITEVREP